MVDKDVIKEQQYILTPGRYVGIEELEVDDVPFDVKIKSLSSELEKLFSESNKLQSEILNNLKNLSL